MRSHYPVLSVLALLLLAVTGCRESSSGSEEILLTRDLVTIGDERTGLSFIGQAFPQAWVSEPVRLGTDYSLRFIPIVAGTGESAYIRVLVRTGKTDQDIASVEAVAESELGQDLSLLLESVDIDLSSFRGRTVEVIFYLESSAASQTGIVGLPHLRPRLQTPSRSVDVLMICTDTLRWDASIGEQGRGLMPSLSSLPGDVVVYPRTFSAASWTMPSITTALTGLYPRYHGTGERARSDSAAPPPGHFNFQMGERPTFLRAYPRDLESLPERLLAAGHATNLVAGNPLYFPSGLARDGFEIAVHAKVSYGDVISRHARHLMASAEPGSPLFLLVHYMDPHDWQRRYARLFGIESRPVAHPEMAREAYEDAVRDGDRALAALIEDWTRLRGGQPLILFWSDHGEHLAENGLIGHGNSMREVLLQVPLVVSYPPELAARAVQPERMVSLADLTPTVLDAVGVDYDPASLSGRSLLRPVGFEERTHFADYQLYGRELASVRRGEHKLVIDLDSGFSELWRVDSDGDETRVENARLAKELYQRYQDYLASALEARRQLDLPEDVDQQEALEALRALGYVE